jgi:hypothetical protein
MTKIVQFVAFAQFCFMFFAGYHFARYYLTDIKIETVNLLIFTCAGFTILFVQNIIPNGIMLLAAIPVINHDIANWNEHLRPACV